MDYASDSRRLVLTLRPSTNQITIKDKDMLDGLTKGEQFSVPRSPWVVAHSSEFPAGFKLNPYPAGLFIKYFRDGGG